MNAKLIALAIALIGSSSIAHAELTSTSGPTSFSGSASVTATANSVASATATNSNAAIATVGVGQFDSSTGVLMGATVQLDSSRTQTISGVGSKNNGPGRDASGSGNSTALLSAAGVNNTFATPITATGASCSLAMGPTGYVTCAWGPVNMPGTTTNVSASVNNSNLNSYVGAGSTNLALSLPSLQATSTLSRTQGQASSSSTTYTTTWSGTVQANYSYLLHAAPSFDVQAQSTSLTLNFGTVAQGSSAAPLLFTLYNMQADNRVGLDLDSISGSGDTGKLTTDLTSFTNMGQGYNQSLGAWLDTSTVGSFSAHYLLTLSDADVGASNTRGTYQMDINLVGNVAAVPEPETYALMLAGLGLMGFVARRRQQRNS